MAANSTTAGTTPYTGRGLFSIDERTPQQQQQQQANSLKTSSLPTSMKDVVEEEDDEESRPLLPASINSDYGVAPKIEQLRKRSNTNRNQPDTWKLCSNTSTQSILKSCLYGVINSIILVPVLIGFASIIFRNKYFSSAMPYLVKLVMLSGTIHQLMFTLFSSLPFAIGQVQDAGLIFLSSMASSIVHSTTLAGLPHTQIMATVLCWLSLSTAFLGVALWITGKLKLASLVQYLPMPVVGGYLAYIGLFCLEAGFSLMTGVQVNNVLDWKHLFHKDPMLLILPGIVLGFALIFITNRFRHFLVFPCLLLSIPIMYYIVIAIGGYSLEDARAAHGYGWMAQPTNETTKFWLVYEHFKFQEIHWESIPRLIPSWIAMYFVVAFSSSLDVAAIQMEVRRSLDFNHELMTVGLANVISGMTGGFTGSYIFSQTIFTMRAQIDSRAVGFIIVFFEFLFFLLPISVLSYIPYFFFGAILTFIAIDLMLTWLYRSLKLVSMTEYFVIWATFIAINALNLEFGMLIGIGISVLFFIFQYSRLHQTEIIIKRSNVMRSFAERSILGDQHTSVVLLKVQGYIFFGSALGILKEVKAALHLPKKEKPAVRPQSVEMLSDTLKNPIPLYLILDMRQVTGIDATACRACFVPLKQLMVEYDICMVFTNLRVDVERLLRAHQVLDDNSLGEV
jgi:SulP family sulfate permease